MKDEKRSPQEMGGDLDSPMPEDEDVEMSDASKKSPQKIEEPINFSQANESDMPIDELLKQNNDEDIIVDPIEKYRKFEELARSGALLANQGQRPCAARALAAAARLPVHPSSLLAGSRLRLSRY